MEFITAIPLDSVGPTAIIALGIIAIIRGDLVPRKSHEQTIHFYDNALTNERVANRQLRAALSALVTEHGTTTDKVLSSLPTPKTEGGDDDSGNP